MNKANTEAAALWPALPSVEEWEETYATLHMWLQIVGKVRLELSPWLNHSWGSALYLTPCGFTTSILHDDACSFAIDFDFVEHALHIVTSSGQRRSSSLEPMSVATFYKRTMSALQDLGIRVQILARPKMQEAYSHELSSAGFWPGMGFGEAAFYSYAYPAPVGFSDAVVSPPEAFYHSGLGEFILPYEAVRKAQKPDQVLLSFLQSTYDAAAKLATWDRGLLEWTPPDPVAVRASQL